MHESQNRFRFVWNDAHFGSLVLFPGEGADSCSFLVLTRTPAVSPCLASRRQLQHAGAADGEFENVPVRGEEPAQEKQPVA